MTRDDDLPPPAADAGARDDGGELTAGERALVARWQPPAPPAGFAERVLAPTAARRPRRARWLGAALLAAVASVTAVVAWPSDSSSPAAVATAGERRALAARESLSLGRRGVAVAEPGAVLAWQQLGPSLVVRQDAGDVFYRVDPGGPFTVVTPVGQVKVTGTCFRVEIIMKQGIIGGVLGAAVATAAVVTVYEGKIVVVGDGGTRTASAGERVAVAPGGAPFATATTPDAPPAGDGGGPTRVILTLAAAPTDATTREELLERDRVQREQLAMLTKRLQELEQGGGKVRRGPGGPRGLDEADYVDPTPAELADYAKECRVRIDLPPVMRGAPMRIPPEWAQAIGLTDTDVAAVNQVFVDLSADWARRVRGWYIEATGDTTGGDTLSAHAMGQELRDKAEPREPDLLQKRIAEERAGILRPPADLARTSPYERYFRSMTQLGDEAERLIADKIGGEKAHKLRRHEGGWPMRMDMAGCSEEGAGGVP